MTRRRMDPRKHLTALAAPLARLSITKKLLLIVVVYVAIIVALLGLVSVVMKVTSGARAYIFGEGLWSKGQKDAVYYLMRYAVSYDERDYEKYSVAVAVPVGDHDARVELEKPHFDVREVYRGFIAGGNHPDDIPGMIFLFRRFRTVSYLDRSIGAWARADVYIEALRELGEELRREIEAGQLTKRRENDILLGIEAINSRLTPLEREFSESLADGARWLRSLLLQMMLASTVVLLAVGLGISLVVGRHMRAGILHLRAGAARVARGDFSQPIEVESGDELGDLAAAFNEMTARRQQAEEELKTAWGDALQASRAKSEFLASMSHEIRTPMNSIIGLADLLGETPLGPDQRGYVQGLTAAGNTLLNLINDILDLSRIEAGHVDLERIELDLRDLVDKTAEVFVAGAREKGLDLSWNVAAGVPSPLTGDPGRIRQILMNLIGNAIKFTERGRVEVRVEGAAGSPGRVCFSVADTGIGIPADKLDAVFERFTQADSSTTRKYGGTGLGLSICKRLVELMGGRIWVESQVGRGSTFCFTLYLEPAPAARDLRPVAVPRPAVAPPSPSSSSPAGFPEGDTGPLRILLAEDSEDNRMLIQTYFKRRADQIDIAENGAEAVEKFKSARYDVVLMDMQMPVMDGYDATRAIRSWEREAGRPPVPIIALTAYALKEERAKSLDAGCTIYLTKPIKKATLMDVVDEQARRPA